MTRNSVFVLTVRTLASLKSRYNGKLQCVDCGKELVPDEKVHARRKWDGQLRGRAGWYVDRKSQREYFCEECWNKQYH